MKKIVSLSLMFLLSCVSILALADKASDKVTKAVAAQVELLRKAMIAADGPMLKKLTHSQLSYGHSGGRVEGQAEFMEKILSGESDFVTMDLNDQTIQIVNDIAIVRHMLVATTNNRGEAGEITLGVMLIWKKSHGHWLLLARQAFLPH